jgi:hypothetical protein
LQGGLNFVVGCLPLVIGLGFLPPAVLSSIGMTMAVLE